MLFDFQTLQNTSTEMLREVVRICEKENIPYFLFYGSLIGTVRHHGMIPWDSDVDIAVPENAYDRFSRAMETQLDSKYWWDFRCKDAPPRCFGRVGLAGFDTYYLHLDIYRLIGYSGQVRRDARMSRFGHLLLRMRLVKTVDPLLYSGRKRRLTKLLRLLLAPIPTRAIVRRFDRLCARYPYAEAPVVGTVDGPKYLFDRTWVQDWIYGEYEGMRVRIPKDYDKILAQFYGDYLTPPPGIDKDAARQRRVEIHER